MSISRIGSALTVVAALSGCVTTAPKNDQNTLAKKITLDTGARLDVCLPAMKEGQSRTSFSVRMDGVIVAHNMATGEVLGEACGVSMSRKNSDGVSNVMTGMIKMGQTTEVTVGDSEPGKEVMLTCEKRGLIVDTSRTEAKGMSCPDVAAEQLPPRLALPTIPPIPLPAQQQSDVRSRNGI